LGCGKTTSQEILSFLSKRKRILPDYEIKKKDRKNITFGKLVDKIKFGTSISAACC
jgi:hypothetical protein